MAKLFGVDIMINFRQPYLAVNITDFWRRWHVSLSSWLKDYLYIPLGGNRKGKVRTYLNLMVTMLLGGLWHGANWTFVVWGGLHGTYLAIHKLLLRGRKPCQRMEITGPGSFISTLFKVGFTFSLVLLTWLFFRARDFGNAWAVLHGILSFRGPVPGRAWLSLAAVSLLLLAYDATLYFLDREEVVSLVPSVARTGVVLGAWIVVIAHLIFTKEMPFIYFRF